jgi:hypothetical protein
MIWKCINARAQVGMDALHFNVWQTKAYVAFFFKIRLSKHNDFSDPFFAHNFWMTCADCL